MRIQHKEEGDVKNERGSSDEKFYWSICRVNLFSFCCVKNPKHVYFLPPLSFGLI